MEPTAGASLEMRPIAVDVGEVIAAEYVVDSNVTEKQVAVTAKVDVFEHQVPLSPLVVALLHGGDGGASARTLSYLPSARQRAT